MLWKSVAIVVFIGLMLSSCTDTPNKKCDWVGPGARAVHVCKPAS